MKNSWKIILFVFLGMAFGCEEDEFGEVHQNGETFLQGEGFFILNEGNFTHSSGSVSFYSFDSSKIYNNLFYTANGRPLGDVPLDMIIGDTTAWIVVNNSSKIEQVSLHSFHAKATTEGFVSPRKILTTGPDKAYVSDLYSDSLVIFDYRAGQIAGYIDIGRSGEEMVQSQGNVFVANWSQLAHPHLNNNKIIVIDSQNDEIVDSATVNKEPNSMVVDRNGDVWVLCSGGYQNEDWPALCRIDAQNTAVEKVFRFPEKAINPNELAINAAQDTLYFLNDGVYRMAINEEQLPGEPWLQTKDRLLYALQVIDDYVVVSDAMDYQQKGTVYIYNKHAQQVDSVRAGVIPGIFAAK